MSFYYSVIKTVASLQGENKKTGPSPVGPDLYQKAPQRVGVMVKIGTACDEEMMFLSEANQLVDIPWTVFAVPDFEAVQPQCDHLFNMGRVFKTIRVGEDGDSTSVMNHLDALF